MIDTFSIIRNTQDKILITRTRTGDERAYACIYDRYFKDIYTFIFCKVSSKETAEDLASEVFLNVWKHIYAKGHVDNLRAFLFAAARNSVIDYYRKKKDLPLEEGHEEEIRGTGRSLEDAVTAAQEMTGIYRALKTLKDEYQEVIILRYLQSFSYKEVARMLGRKTGTVRVLAHRAMEELKKALSS